MRRFGDTHCEPREGRSHDSIAVRGALQPRGRAHGRPALPRAHRPPPVAAPRGGTSDIKKEGVTELASDRTPTRAAATLPGLWKVTQRNLGKVAAPTLVYHSTEDHIVGPASLAILRKALPATQLEVTQCPNSYHVATLDNDAEAIFACSLAVVRSHSHAGKE